MEIFQSLKHRLLIKFIERSLKSDFYVEPSHKFLKMNFHRVEGKIIDALRVTFPCSYLSPLNQYLLVDLENSVGMKYRVSLIIDCPEGMR